MAKHLSAKIWLRLAALTGSFILAPQQASAQMAIPATAGWTKTDAILGGTPSALQAILAQQSGGGAPSRALLQPASFSIVPMIRAIARPASSPAALSGRPDIFGSVALRVDHTPLDSRWQRVEHAGLTGLAARFAKSLRDRDEVERLNAVNRYVNRRVQYVDDQRQYGRADVWSAADNTLRRGRGDCEDFAIAKLQMLRQANFSDRNLYLVIVKDLVRRADHAVVVVRAAGHMFMLDDGTDTLLDSDTVADYRPILTFAANGAWTHGYRMPAAPINVASAESAPTVLASADQRSWSASLLAFNTGFNK
jgi:predicted transglutaminase-like cysteine proteinase